MDEAYVERVLSLVERIPEGKVLPYGRIAELLADGYGPRYVGRIMSTHGHAVCWWRVPRADGTMVPPLMIEAQARWADEGTPVRNGRVHMAEALWTDVDPEGSV
ncbi:MGMT family protein [Aeromicrobium sp. 50.2.37]|uniref:MGMT family protein n=1 Tax=Aeromicrobium sp. 50.2.37 TaxID=2969305 RepID=UPI00214F74AD|nr:MGMT family protein [Aeromicrobium sp. 50.2.37]MCR4514717.1 MGMT family protein [Aeromicrobium sp. 50.2.37]